MLAAGEAMLVPQTLPSITISSSDMGSVSLIGRRGCVRDLVCPVVPKYVLMKGSSG